MKSKIIPLWKVFVGVLLAIVCLAIAQILSFEFGELIVKVGSPVWISNILMSLIYVLMNLVGLKLIVEKFLKQTTNDYRILPFKINLRYILVGIGLTSLVVLGLFITNGELVKGTGENKLAIVTGSVFFYGIATGIVEESVFRGVIMGLIEDRWNKKIAIFVPSILFGLLHILGNELTIVSTIQLIIAGSIVGILFSLVTIESNSIWNSAIVHSIWNSIFVGGILNIGVKNDPKAIYNIVLKSQNTLITGGDFGVEASIIAIIAYLLFTGCVLYWINNKSK